MNRRLHAALVISRRQLFETLIAPGLWITLALGLVLGYLLITGFAASVDSAGFNPTLNPLYDLVGRALAGAFGMAFVTKLFAEGPFLLALAVAFLPVFLFLAISSVFRFGQEKNAGAVELLSYGPSDGTSYLMASFLRDVGSSAFALLVIAGFMAAAAALGNLALGPMFLFCLPLLFLVSLAVSAYGILCAILSSNPSSALAAFFGIMLLFLLSLGGQLAIAGASVRTVASVAAAVLQWVSPLWAASLCLRAFQAGSLAALLLGIGLMLALTAALLVAGHLAIRRRGVRA
jgi:hypothetical protein